MWKDLDSTCLEIFFGSIKKIKFKDMIHGKNKKNPILFDYTSIHMEYDDGCLIKTLTRKIPSMFTALDKTLTNL